MCAAPSLESYGNLPGVEIVRLSPSGTRYAFIAVVNEARMFAVTGEEGKVLYSVTISDTKARDIRWVGEDHVLVVLSSTFNAPLDFRFAHELASVINVRLSDKKVFRIFEQHKDVSQVVFGDYGSAEIDGHTYGYFGALTLARTSAGYFFQKGWPDLYRVDLDSGEKMRVAKGSAEHRGWVVAADGTIVAHARYRDKTGLWQLYAGNNRGKLLFEKSSMLGRIYLIGKGRSAGTALIADSEGDEDTLIELSVSDNRQEQLCDDMYADNYAEDPDTGHILGCLSKDAPQALLFDSKLQARFNGTRRAFPGHQMHLVSFSRNMDRLIVFTDGGDDSGTYWMVDIAGGRADPVGRAYPSIRSADVGPTSLFSYKASDGRQMEAVLTLPPGREAKALPLVMLPHGGPLGVSDRLGFDWWAQAYASVGYAVLQPNYRGSAGYGREFREAGYGQWGNKMLSDIADGMSALAASGTIDPERACIVGGSYGGYAALAGVTLQNGLYRCAVAVAGPADMASFLRWERERHGSDSDTIRFFRAVTATTTWSAEDVRSISPALNAERADAPILLIHGKDDTVVDIEQSRKMEVALKRAGKPVEFLVMDGEDHWLSRQDTRTKMLKAAVAFVQKHNPAD